MVIIKGGINISSPNIPLWVYIAQSLSIVVGLIVMYTRTKKDHPRILKQLQQIIFLGTKKDD
jgi:hypothetical protein